ncbi:hypothetical protein [Hyphococcus luteus]|uniref:Uncharacterized protein n=1 Tax=Hyphococcus luteus TaxID=2058213 RepID=A0A2S7KAH7_9PROT|nr:hypothetical protein [Marinicaulis flavus]PQA89483.1 hypothetical protein CW354_01000 [Marinicaulis flavus]
MNSAAPYPSDLNLYIEAFVALFITGVFVVSAMLTLRDRHRDRSAWHVYLGAAIYGALFGAIIGFIIVPLRMALMNGDMPTGMAGYSGLGALVLIIALRRGLIARLPFLGPQVKAYRRASLRRQIEAAQKQLDKLTPNTGSDAGPDTGPGPS